MSINIDFNNLSKEKLSEDKIIARKILNVCSFSHRASIDDFMDILPIIKTKHLILARKILYSEDKELTSMSQFEYLVENLLNTPILEMDEEEEDIYV